MQTWNNEPAISYGRVSREEQLKGYSIAEQLSANESYAERAQLHTIAELFDDESGMSLERDHFTEALNMLRRGAAKHLIVWVVDRLSREPEDFFPLRKELRRLGVIIHYSQRGRASLPGDEDGEFFEDLEAVFAKRERNKFIARSLAGRWRKAMSGYIPGNARPAYGYRRIGETRTLGYEIDEEQAATVRQVFLWYAHDRVSPTEIARRLSVAGTLAPGDINPAPNKKVGRGQWSPSAIYHILRNEIYAGRYRVRRISRQSGGWKKQPADKHIIIDVPAIIDDELWQAAQHRLDTGRQQSPRNLHRQTLMGRRLRCGACGAAVHAAHGRGNHKKGKKRYSYYECSSRSLALGPCGMRAFPVGEVDDFAWSFVQDILLRPDLLLQRQQWRDEDRQAAYERQRATAADLEQQINRQEQKLANVLNRLTEPGLSTDELALFEQQRVQALQTLKELRERYAAAHVRLNAPIPTSDLLSSLDEYRARSTGVLARNDLPLAEKRGFIDDLDITGELMLEDRTKVLYLIWNEIRERYILTSPVR
jgi:site-specific DNA recombinase